MERNIYGRKEKYENELEKIEQAPITPKNKELIKKWNNERLARNLKHQTVYKRSAQLRRIAEILDKDFTKCTREDVLGLMSVINTKELKTFAPSRIWEKVSDNPKQYSPVTKKDYWRITRRFFTWLEKEEVLKNAAPVINVHTEIGQIITEEHLKKVVKKLYMPRDKALLWVLHETGARATELLNMDVGDVKRMKTGVRVRLYGKTGERFVRLIKSSPYLLRWLEEHPFAKNDMSPLWISKHNKYAGKSLNYIGLKQVINKAFKKAKLEHIRHNPHFFRHSRATIMAKYLTEPLMRLYFGWAPGSDQVKVYVHASGRDLDDALLGMYGYKEKEDMASENIPKECEICKTENGCTSSYCSNCGNPLDVITAVSGEEKYSREFEKTMEVIQQVMSNPELLKKFQEYQKK